MNSFEVYFTRWSFVLCQNSFLVFKPLHDIYPVYEGIRKEIVYLDRSIRKQFIYLDVLDCGLVVQVHHHVEHLNNLPTFALHLLSQMVAYGRRVSNFSVPPLPLSMHCLSPLSIHSPWVI